MIVPTEHVELSRKLCETLAGPGGAGMFTTPLSTTGDDPATHYISSGLIESDFADLLAAVDVSEQAAQEALDRLGLRLSAEPEEM